VLYCAPNVNKHLRSRRQARVKGKNQGRDGGSLERLWHVQCGSKEPLGTKAEAYGKRGVQFCALLAYAMGAQWDSCSMACWQ